MIDENTTDLMAFLAMPAVSAVRGALCYLRQRQLSELLEELASADPARETAAEDARQQQTLELALRSLTISAERGAPGDALTSYWLARQRELAHEPEEARRYIDSALRLAPDDLEILEFASNLFHNANDMGAERRALQRLHELEPDLVDVRRRLGFNYWSSGERAAAKSELEPIVGDASLVGDERAFTLTCLGRHAEALEVWVGLADQQKASEGKYSDSAELTLAIAYELAGDADQAVTHYLEFVQRQPNAVDPAIIPTASPFPDVRESMQRVLELTLARHPELRAK
jgi:tetratricopeptide (TPR) repeat protein